MSQNPCTDEIKSLYIDSAPSLGDVPWTAGEALRVVLAPLLAEQRESVEQLAALYSQAAIGIVQAAKKTGDPMWHVARGAADGVLHAAVEARVDPFAAMVAVTRGMVAELLDMEGDFAAAAKGAVQGAIEAAEELGLDPQRAAHLAARAGFETSDAVRKAAGIRVMEVVGWRVMGYATGLEDEAA
jgi:hypothetical protein